METQQFYPQVVPDQSGGVIAIWQEFTADMDSAWINAQHLNINGLKLWAAAGIKISGSDAISTTPLAVSDGSGGVIVSWLKTENGAINHYIQRVSPTGNILWNPEGVAVCPNSNATGYYYQLISDGKGAPFYCGMITAAGRIRTGSMPSELMRAVAAPGPTMACR